MEKCNEKVQVLMNKKESGTKKESCITFEEPILIYLVGFEKQAEK